ncbi:unnamed protein product [Paramecium sonneborni]|uniref:Uncharacterized protein n=1 Tax=Paramecium sonneborni TaxID=65129 RepID=A0A8S1KPD0_9CILI|nr:unnamed protein product [Paramecium sonneborni]
MNYYKQHALQHMAQVEPEGNFFIFHPNTPFTSSRTKQNRVLAFLLQKLVMLRKYENLCVVILLLLKELTGQFFYANYQGNSELRQILIYYNNIIFQNPGLYQQFYNTETPQKFKFQLWLKSLTHLDDDKLQIEIEKYSYDHKYINMLEYEILLSITHESEIDLTKIKNGYILLKLINYKEDEERLQILKKMKDCYMNESYILKKEWLFLMIKMDKKFEIQELNNLSQVDLFDSHFQFLLVSSYLKLDQEEKAIEQLINHLHYSDGNSEIWALFQQQLTQQLIDKHKSELVILIKLHFGQGFFKKLMEFPKDQESIRLLQTKIGFLSLFNEEQSQKYLNFLQQQEQICM